MDDLSRTKNSMMRLRFTAEGGVETMGAEEFFMRAPFDDPAPFHHKNLVGMAHGGEAVGDDETGTACQEMLKGLLNEALGRIVDTGGGLIEHKDWRVLQQGAGNGETLFFPDA